jgi:hypothetical protein
MQFFQDHIQNPERESTDSLKGGNDMISKAAMNRDFSKKYFRRDQRIPVREWSHLQAVLERNEDIVPACHMSDIE